MLSYGDRSAIENVISQGRSLHPHMASMLVREIERLEKALADKGRIYPGRIRRHEL